MLSKALKKNFSSTSSSQWNQEITEMLCKTIINSGVEPLQTTPSLLSNLNSDVTHLVLSNPHVSPLSCLDFFRFLQRNESFTVQKPDLLAHVTLVCRLYGARRFAAMKNISRYVVTDANLRCPVSVIVLLIERSYSEPKFVDRLCDMLMGVYADNRMFEEAVGVFDYMEKNGLEIEESSCFVLLVALKRYDRVESCLGFFRRIVAAGVESTVYSMTTVIDGLCKGGEIEKGRQLMGEMVDRGIKPDVITYNTLANALLGKGILWV